MRNYFSKFKLLFVSILFMFSILPSFAQENIISSVTISKAKNSVSTYELNIDSSDTSDYKMSIEDDTSVYFDIKNAILADDSATYYDDVANINSIVVKQIGHNKVRIYLQGKNVKNTRIIFVNSFIENTKDTKKSITLNRPINEYKSINSTDLEDMNNIQNWDDNSFNFGQFMTSLKDGVGGIILVFLMIFGIIVYSIKMLSRKLSQETEPLIGLKQQKEEEILNKKQMYQNSSQANTDMQSITKRAQALQNAQNELFKAHQKYQEYLKTKYKDTPKKQYVSDSITKGIALSQYQKSNENPYKDQQVIKMSQTRDYPLPQGNFQIPPKGEFKNNLQTVKRQTNAIQKNTAPYIKKPSKKNNEQPKMYTKPNNMKFLESVTKIYEQSGRIDLADELKNTMTKSKRL